MIVSMNFVFYSSSKYFVYLIIEVVVCWFLCVFRFNVFVVID